MRPERKGIEVFGRLTAETPRRKWMLEEIIFWGEGIQLWRISKKSFAKISPLGKKGGGGASAFHSENFFTSNFTTPKNIFCDIFPKIISQKENIV